MQAEIHRNNVSRETLTAARDLYGSHFDLMETYLDELLWWNQKVNLVSRDVSRETLQEHLVHSLLPSVMGLTDGIKGWVDAGTGGGLPGIPLAITGQEKNWLLNDIVTKKIAAVKQIIHKLNLLNASGEAGSLAEIEIPEASGIITKHAFPLGKILELLDGKPWKKLIMYKGVTEANEEVLGQNNSYKYSLSEFDFGEKELFYKGKGLLTVENYAAG